jgi:hypothetical protein
MRLLALHHVVRIFLYRDPSLVTSSIIVQEVGVLVKVSSKLEPISSTMCPRRSRASTATNLHGHIPP